MTPPADCPLPPSPLLGGLRFTGRILSTQGADTWYPSWAEDGNLYTPFADGVACNMRVDANWNRDLSFVSGLCRDGASGHSRLVSNGAAIIAGDDPFAPEIRPCEPVVFHSPRFHGLYPCASLMHRGVWSYGTYYVHRWIDPAGRRITYELGPVPGFRTSRDGGRSWDGSVRDDRTPLFPEVGRVAGGPPIRIGSPHAVDHGRALQHAPDGRFYIIAHGCRDRSHATTWISGDEIVVARCEPDPAALNDPACWEFLTGTVGGRPRWSRNFAEMAPIVTWPGRCGCVNATWVPALGRYLMMVSAGPDHGGEADHDTWIAEAEHLWGPWRLVDWWPAFGSRGYFVCMPSKFLSSAGDRAVLYWSANWMTPQPPHDVPWPRESPPGSRYALCVGEFEFLRK